MPVRTSATDPLRVDWLPLHGPGAVGLTIAPGRRGTSLTGGFLWVRDLGADLRRLREVERVDVLVCLLGDQELERLGIHDLVPRAREDGLLVLRLPIVDGWTPEERRPVRRLLQSIGGAVAGGRRVVIHCAGGLGRAGTIAGCYLVERGLPAADALGQLALTRGPRCPETEAQRTYIRRWSAR